MQDKVSMQCKDITAFLYWQSHTARHRAFAWSDIGARSWISLRGRVQQQGANQVDQGHSRDLWHRACCRHYVHIYRQKSSSIHMAWMYIGSQGHMSGRIHSQRDTHDELLEHTFSTGAAATTSQDGPWIGASCVGGGASRCWKDFAVQDLGQLLVEARWQAHLCLAGYHRGIHHHARHSDSNVYQQHYWCGGRIWIISHHSCINGLIHDASGVLLRIRESQWKCQIVQDGVLLSGKRYQESHGSGWRVPPFWIHYRHSWFDRPGGLWYYSACHWGVFR